MLYLELEESSYVEHLCNDCPWEEIRGCFKARYLMSQILIIFIVI